MEIHDFKKILKKYAHEGKIAIDAILAAKILNECEYGRQRAVSKKRVNYWVNVMYAGEFSKLHYINFGALNDSILFLNGYHRLNAIIQYAEKYENRTFYFKISLESFANMDEINKYYGELDFGKIKNVTDYVKALRGDNKYPPIVEKGIYRAIRILNYDFDYRKVLNSDTGGYLSSKEIKENKEKYEQYFNRYVDLIINCKPKPKPLLKNKLLSPVFLALGVATSEHPDWQDFWTGIAGDDGLKKGDARKTALSIIIETKLYNSPPQYRLFTNKIIRCWNNYVVGRDCSFVQVNNVEGILPIKGHHYDI